MEYLFKKLHLCGGAIMRDCDVTPAEKQRATQEGNVFVDGEGLVFVWIRSQKTTGIGWGQ